MPSISAITPATFDSGRSVTLSGSGFGASQGSILIAGQAQTVTSWSDTSITFTTVRGLQSAGACRVDVVKAASGGVLSGPAVYTVSGNEGASGSVFINGADGNQMMFDNTRAFSGTQSIKCNISLGQAPSICGGSHNFGGRMTWATGIPSGYNIWYQARFFLPSTMPMGYVFGNTDTADAAACGKFADGSTNLKWLAIEDSDQTVAGYLQLKVPRRAFGPSNGVNLALELESGAEPDYTVTIPRDTWFTLQMHVYLSDVSGGGFMRAWKDSQYIGQLTQKSIGVGKTIKGVRLGNYWNGVPWTDGSAGHTNAFWMDDVIVASDYPGFGAPTATDSGGRTYISPTATVEAL